MYSLTYIDLNMILIDIWNNQSRKNKYKNI